MQNGYEFVGTIAEIRNTQTFRNNFTTRDVVLMDMDVRHPQKVVFQFQMKRTTLLDSYAVGQQVKIVFTLRGNEYNGKYFVSLNGMSIAPCFTQEAMMVPMGMMQGVPMQQGIPAYMPMQAPMAAPMPAMQARPAATASANMATAPTA